MSNSTKETCRFFKEGTCKKGRDCPFLHQAAQAAQAAKPTKPTKAAKGTQATKPDGGGGGGGGGGTARQEYTPTMSDMFKVAKTNPLNPGANSATLREFEVYLESEPSMLTYYKKTASEEWERNKAAYNDKLTALMTERGLAKVTQGETFVLCKYFGNHSLPDIAGANSAGSALNNAYQKMDPATRAVYDVVKAKINECYKEAKDELKAEEDQAKLKANADAAVADKEVETLDRIKAAVAAAVADKEVETLDRIKAAVAAAVADKEVETLHRIKAAVADKEVETLHRIKAAVDGHDAYICNILRTMFASSTQEDRDRFHASYNAAAAVVDAAAAAPDN
jgi:hypothetical protein